MYRYLKGTLVEKHPMALTLDVANVGYFLLCPLSTLSALPDIGHETTVYTYLYVREDALRLYGFASVHEQRFFEMLLSVGGLGPKVALNILSHVTTHAFSQAILTGNIATLTRIPGIGKKSAERIILELKSKITQQDMPHATPPIETNAALLEDVAAALMALGYNKPQAQKAIDKLTKKHTVADMPVEEMIKTCLESL